MQYQSFTIPHSGKKRNGDHFHLQKFEKERLLVAAVADGVSGQPCDWRASEMACTYFFQYFESGLGLTRNIPHNIEQSVLSTQLSIIEENRECKGMAATFSLVVWPYETDKLYWCNIGDSRIYTVLHDNVTCITKDDSITSPSGHSLLTQCLGKGGLKFEVKQAEMKPGQTIMLCSDGFYNSRKASLNSKLIAFANTENFESDFLELTKDFSMLRGDDLTVVAIKNE